MRERYNCPECNALHTTKLSNPYLLVCVTCGTEIVLKNRTPKLPKIKMPNDWAFIQIGTTGTYKDNFFTVVGRVRLQLRNDYKTFWCAEHSHGQYIWLTESFASLAVLNPPWKEFMGTPTQLKSGNSIKVGDLRLIGEFVEKCESISFQGEVGEWKYLTPGFFVIQASRNDNQTATFFIAPSKGSEVLIGEKFEAERLKLNNIIDFHDWR